MFNNSRKWFDAMRAHGHMPRMDKDGHLDVWVEEEGEHNGPGCETCGWSCCMWCRSVEDIPECGEPPLELKAVEVSGKMIARPK